MLSSKDPEDDTDDLDTCLSKLLRPKQYLLIQIINNVCNVHIF